VKLSGICIDSVIPFEEYLRIFLCVLEIVTLSLPIPQCTEDYTINVNVMYGSQCVDQRMKKHHHMGDIVDKRIKERTQWNTRR
jgi:hypothetical protein